MLSLDRVKNSDIRGKKKRKPYNKAILVSLCEQQMWKNILILEDGILLLSSLICLVFLIALFYF